ncbi:MAG: hypothetical protein ACM3WQ_03530 [Chloroflexota bacterium]
MKTWNITQKVQGDLDKRIIFNGLEGIMLVELKIIYEERGFISTGIYKHYPSLCMSIKVEFNEF